LLVFLKMNKVLNNCVFLLLILQLSCTKKEAIIEPVKNPAILSFVFSKGANPNLPQEIRCEIIGDTIIATTFASVNLKSLIPSFVIEGKEVIVENIIQKSEITNQDFSKIIKYILKGFDGTEKIYFVKFTDTSIPVLEIDTKNIAIESKTNYVQGFLKIKEKITGDSLFSGTIEIRGRGNSTWGLAKKPYKIKLSKGSKLLGMNEAKQWVLLANYSDKTLLRNELGFELSRRLELKYTPTSRLVDVVLNGNYIGNYQLVEQIEVSKNKVNVATQKKGEVDISGGYLIEGDGFYFSEKVFFKTAFQMPISVHYPDDEAITLEQTNYIKNHLKNFETDLFSDTFEDKTNGFRKYFDVDSYINFYLVNEIMGNPDLFWSTYFYKNKTDSKLYAGPVWDFDIAANNDYRKADTQNLLMLDIGFEPKIWINQLLKDKEFKKRIRSRWNEIKGEKLNTLEKYIDLKAAEINKSQQKNFYKWPILNEKIYNNYQVAGSYPGEVTYLKNYIKNRIIWLDGQFNSIRFE
jgi:hypothetical protein